MNSLYVTLLSIAVSAGCSAEYSAIETIPPARTTPAVSAECPALAEQIDQLKDEFNTLKSDYEAGNS